MSEMGKFLGIIVSDSTRMGCCLSTVTQDIKPPETEEVAGWGLGYHLGGEVLLQKAPARNRALSFEMIADRVRAGDLIAHIAQRAGETWRYDDAPPYRYDGWLLVNNGRLGIDTKDLRTNLLAEVPDFLRRNMRGHSEGEVLLFLFLTYLHKAGLLSPNVDKAQEVSRALAMAHQSAVRLLEQTGHTPGPTNILASNGRVMLASRGGLPLYSRQLDGIESCPICTAMGVDVDESATPYPHPDLRLVAFASDDLLPGAAEKWDEVPEGSVVYAWGPEYRAGLLE